MKPVEVLGPVVVALIAVGTLMALDAIIPERPPREPPAHEPGLLFDHVGVAPDGGSAYLLAPGSLASPCGNATSSPWQTLHRFSVAPGCHYTFGNDTMTVALADGTRVGPGNDTVFVTAYVFTEDGALLATTAPTYTLDRFHLHMDFSRFAPGPWYLGEPPGPNGTKDLGDRARFVADALQGAAVGELRTATLSDFKHEWYLGPLHGVARIEAILSDAG